MFSVFSSRLPDRKRKDIDKILKKYNWEKYDSYEFLKKSGARLPIDNLQFIDPILDVDMFFERTFYIAGGRHYLKCEGENCELAIEVTRGDEAFLVKEPDNIADSKAVKVMNSSNEHLGYIPRYYSEVFTRIIDQSRKYTCYVANVDENKCCDECIALKVTVK